MNKVYLVNNKPDDYGNCILELVNTSLKNAKQYYHYRELQDEDDDIVLSQYLPYIDRAEENERTSEQRYYGNS